MIAADEISYEFTVTNATLYAQQWHAQYILHRAEAPMLEGSCHDGNYVLTNILLGARLGESRAAQAITA